MIVCPICDQKTAAAYRTGVKSVYSQKAYDVMHCSNCDHYFTWPRPSTKELDNIYTKKYSYDAHALIENEKRMRAKNYANYIAALPKVKTAMEVGCMHGLLLMELRDNGVKVSGVELDPEAVAYCRQQGLDVKQGAIEDHLKKAGSTHDVIIMSHVIEHIVDPEKQLKELHKRMSKHGCLVLITPNANAATRKLFGRYWGYWQVPVHINHFTGSSMAELLKNSGFEIVDTKYYGADSLFFLSSLANLMGASNESKHLSAPKKALVKIATTVLRPWYRLGQEDMLILAKKG